MKNAKKLLSLTLVTVLSLSLVACGGEDKKETDKGNDSKEVKGFIYKISKGDEKGYLLGSGNIVPDGLEYYNEDVKKIVEETDGLVLSSLPDEEYQAQAQKAITGNLKEVITEEEYTKFINVLIKDAEFTAQGLETVSPYRAMQYVTLAAAWRNQYTLGATLETILEANYKNKEKEVSGLLKGKEIFPIYNEIYSTKFFKDYLKDFSMETITKLQDKMVSELAAYKKGDISVFEKHVTEVKANSPSEYEGIKKVNALLTDKMVQKLASKKNYSYVIPAESMVGEDGVIKLLEGKGYKVERIN
ncbi:MAG: TraB/GumN family protein [Clostridium sp.]